MLNNIGLPGILLIAVVVLVLFGRGKISSLMGEVGKGITAFKKGVDDGKKELENEAADVARDVTPERTLRERLRRSDELFQGYMANSTENIYCFEIDPPMPLDLTVEEQLDYLYDHTRVAVANAAWARQAGYDGWKRIVGLPLDEVVPRVATTQKGSQPSARYSATARSSRSRITGNLARISFCGEVSSTFACRRSSVEYASRTSWSRGWSFSSCSAVVSSTKPGRTNESLDVFSSSRRTR